MLLSCSSGGCRPPPRSVAKTVAWQDGRLEICALVSAVVVVPEHLRMLGGHARSFQRQRFETTQRQAATFMVRGRHHHDIGVLVDPLSDEFHHVIVHDRVVEMSTGSFA